MDYNDSDFRYEVSYTFNPSCTQMPTVSSRNNTLVIIMYGRAFFCWDMIDSEFLQFICYFFRNYQMKILKISLILFGYISQILTCSFCSNMYKKITYPFRSQFAFAPSLPIQQPLSFFQPTIAHQNSQMEDK